MDVEKQLALLKRGCVDIITEEDLRERLLEGRPLKVKVGFDPTASDIHLGHTVLLRKMRHFQDLGHRVFFLIGDFTGQIGDPSGKWEARKKLTHEQVMENAQTYQKQAFKVLDPQKTETVFNSQWLAKMGLADVLELASKYTLARLLERDDFSKRLSSGQPISTAELLYPLMQAYDSIALEADVELGGTDQIFNLLVGRQLQKEYGQKPQIIMTLPLLEGTDGVQKMSKTLKNYIGIAEPPSEIFGKTMSIPDRLIGRYFRLLTDVSEEEIEQMERAMEEDRLNPMDAKRKLAGLLVSQFHDQREAQEADEEFTRVFSENQLPQEMPLLLVSHEHMDDGKIKILKLLALSGLLSSSSHARRLIRQKGVRLNQRAIEDETQEVSLKTGDILQVGKRHFVKIDLC